MREWGETITRGEFAHFFSYTAAHHGANCKTGGNRASQAGHAARNDNNPVRPERPTVQISSEDTFEHDLLLDELEAQIRRLAEKTWAGYQRERVQHHGRLARTVVLKLKTSDFRILTRSLTPAQRPETLEALADIACELRARVELPSGTRYRLVGVGLSGFVDEDDVRAQSDLFELA